MSKSIGRELEVGYKPEGTRGTAESSASFWQEWSDLEWSEVVEHALREQAKGVVADSDGSKLQQIMSELSFTFPATPETAAYLLYAVLGSKSQTNPETGVYKHTLTTDSDIQLPSYTWFLSNPASGQDLAFPLGVIDELTISQSMNEFAELEASIMAQEPNDVSNSPSHTDMNRFSRKHAQLDIDGSEEKIRSFEINISRDTEADNELGSKDPSDFLGKELTVEGSFDLIYEDTDETDALTGDTKRKLVFTLQNDDVTIGTSKNPKIKITLDRCTTQEVGNEISLGDVATQTVSFKAHYKDSAGQMIKAEVTDTNDGLD